MTDEPAAAQQQFRHRWLYSVLPITDRFTGKDTAKDHLYLSAYCPNCDQAYSSIIPHSIENFMVSKMDVPKWGCANPEFP